jgi:hypothetical protein
MINYGSPRELAEAIRREVELLESLRGLDRRLDAFIKRRVGLLRACLARVEGAPHGVYQLVAVDSCELVPV